MTASQHQGDHIASGRLAGRAALVTGGSRGIGRAIALRLARDGAAVAVNYRRDEQAATETCAAIRAAGGRAEAYRAPVDDAGAVDAMLERVLVDLPDLDIVVVNAGIASRGHTIVDTDPAELQRVYATHVLGAYHVLRRTIPHLRERPRGDVVSVSSVETGRAAPGSGPYTMAKVALEALTMIVAAEEMRYGIHANVVAPGLVVTDMGDRLARAVTDVAKASDLDARSPYGRVCRPEDIADVVAYLVSPEAGYINGQRIAVDAGGSSIASSS